MVCVERHPVVLNLLHLSHEMIVLIVHQGDDGSLVDMLVVETAVDHEGLTVHLVQSGRLIGPECFCGLEHEVEGRTLFNPHQFLFKGIEGNAKTRDKLKRFLRIRLLLQGFLAVL